MKRDNNQEQSFELRSEKVRSIIGHIPSSLTYYGTTTLGLVLLCILSVAYFLPYKQVYSGTATIYNTPITQTDSTDITIHLKFENGYSDNANRQKIYLQSANVKFAGRIRKLSSIRDTLDRHEALCRFKSSELKSIENQTVNFQIDISAGNILGKLIGRF